MIELLTLIKEIAANEQNIEQIIQLIEKLIQLAEALKDDTPIA
jgi:hypothetical protein